MPTIPQIKKFRLANWEKSPIIHNEALDPDEEFTTNGIDDREYRYECSIIRCRSLWDLRMTPSGIFCEAHYLPWLHTDSNGRRMQLNCCKVAGCFEPRVSRRKLCRIHMIADLTDEDVAAIATVLYRIGKDSPRLFGGGLSTGSYSIGYDGGIIVPV
jgi:hypothetical protein